MVSMPVFYPVLFTAVARHAAHLAWHCLQAVRSLLPPASITMSPISSSTSSAVQFLWLPGQHRRLAWSEFGADCSAARRTILTFLPPPVAASSTALLTGRYAFHIRCAVQECSDACRCAVAPCPLQYLIYKL